jgi:hypothetical protein
MMSHPDPLYDEFDMNAERAMFPWIDDESHDRDDPNYDDYNDFTDTVDDEDFDDSYDDSMDGDFDSAMRDAGFGTDEDYGCFGGEDY